MTPLEKIKNGILNQDMSLVAQGYKDLTGEDLLTTAKPARKKKAKKQEIAENDTHPMEQEGFINRGGFWINKSKALPADQVIPKVELNDFTPEQYKKDKVSATKKQYRPPVQLVPIVCKNPSCRKPDNILPNYIGITGEGLCNECRESKLVR